MTNIFKFFNQFQDRIGEPPWKYDFLCSLPESEYPKYLAKIFNYRTGEKLPLSHGVIDKNRCKTFNQKLQWLKLYGVTDLMRKCTDKVAVRDYVKEKIGEEYLKPVLQIIPNETSVIASRNGILDGEAIQPIEKNIQKQLDCRADNKMPPSARNDGKLEDVSTYFDQINWDKLPNAFVIKCNHGCKWHYIIKDKEEFLQNKRLFNTVKQNITGWLEQEYWCWGGFEMQYATFQEKGIEPKILIEPLLRNDINLPGSRIQIYFFNSSPEFIIKIHNPKEITIYDKNFKIVDDVFGFSENKIYAEVDDLINQTFVLSKQIIKDKNINFVRVDWMIYKNKPYFEELTFSPYSGFHRFRNKKNNIKLGNFINL